MAVPGWARRLRYSTDRSPPVGRTDDSSTGRVSGQLPAAQNRMPKRQAPERRKSMKWITRERVKVDRVACPWLIKKFVDPNAEFLFVPTDQVAAIAAREGAIPYDVKDVEL